MPHLTRKEVEKRIANGEPLPDSVLVEYPDIARKYRIVPVKENPHKRASASQIKKHVKRHLDEDGREYRKMIADDEKLKKWMRENPRKSWYVSVTSVRGGTTNLWGFRSREAAKQYADRFLSGDPNIGQVDIKQGIKPREGEVPRKNSPRKSRYHKNAGGDLIKENPGRDTTTFKNFISTRIESPSHFDKRSFRTIVQNDGTEIVIGCSKGHYNAKTGRCKTGTRAQAIRKPNWKSNPLNPSRVQRRRNSHPKKKHGGIMDLRGKYHGAKSRHGNISALKRGMSKHLDETFEQFKKRMIKKHGSVPEKRIRQWFNLRNAGAKALGL